MKDSVPVQIYVSGRSIETFIWEPADMDMRGGRAIFQLVLKAWPTSVDVCSLR